VKRVIEAAQAIVIPVDREILHVLSKEFSVDDQIGVKDPIAASLGKAWKKRKLANFIEIEVATMKEALHAAEVMRKLRKPGDACLVMFDNMNPRQMKRTLEELERKHLRDGLLFEASGGITPKNVREYASSGVDVISMGFLTHSVPALDMCMLIV